MIQHEPDDLDQRCRAVVDRVLERHGWRLLEREEFVRRVVACVAVGEVNTPWAAAIHVYCPGLYTACTGSEGPERQEAAFTELHRYLYELSFREIGDVPADQRQDIVQETLLRIWRNLGRYHKPSAFLAVAALEMRNVVRPLWSRQAFLPLDERLEQPNSPDTHPLAHVLTEELRRQVRTCFDEVYHRRPRARQQLEAVWLKYMLGLDEERICAHLDKPAASVQVLRTRGLTLLNGEPCWQRLARELGLGA